MLHERAGDTARNHHLYVDAAHRYYDALNVQVITAADRLRISEKLAEVLSYTDDPTSAYPLYERLLSASSSAKDFENGRMRLYYTFAHQLWLMSNCEAALVVLTQAINAARSRGDAISWKAASVRKAAALLALGRYEDAQQTIAAVGRLHRNAPVETRVDYFVQRARIDAMYGREKDAYDSFERAMAAAQSISDDKLNIILWHRYACVAKSLGKTEHAKSCYEQALLLSRKANIPWCVATVLFGYAQLLLQMNEVELAHGYFQEAIVHDRKYPVLERYIVSVGIPLSIAAKDAETLARCDRPYVIDAAFASKEPCSIGEVAAAFARLYVETNSLHKARVLLHRAICAIRAIEDAWDLPIMIARYGAINDVMEARKLLARRAALPSASLAEAHLKLFDAFVAQRHGKTHVVHMQATEAVRSFDLLRWHAYADLARTMLPPEPSTPRVIFTGENLSADLSALLTDRERQVASLMLKGQRNREIAQILGISARTVEVHVTSILSKLGARSRYQLTDQAVIVRA